jgi:PKD repeat protein
MMKRFLLLGLLLVLLAFPVSGDSFNHNSTHLVYNQVFPFTYTSASQADVESHCQQVFGATSHSMTWPHEITFYGYTSIGGLNEAYYTSYGEVKTTTKADTVLAMQGGYCTNASGWGASVWQYWNITAPVVSANFNGTPMNGTAPLGVSFVDMSLNATSWNWSVSPPGGVSIIDPTSEDTMIYFATIGNYTITHGASNAGSSDIETKTDYIWVYNSTSTVTTGFQTINVVSGIPINSSINILDIENGSWKNTSSTGVTGVARITSLANHNLNAYASAIGFDDNDLLNQPARDGWGYFIMMVPTGHSNVTPGNVTLYVTVDDFDTHVVISSADVKISYVSGGGGATIRSGQTNAAGVVSFVVPNQTNIIVEARADSKGYLPGGQSINSGSGSGGAASVAIEMSLHKNIVTPTVTVTATGTGTVTPTQTVDPYPCDADHPENCQRKQTELANMLVGYGPQLVLFFIVLTFIGGVKLIGKK